MSCTSSISSLEDVQEREEQVGMLHIQRKQAYLLPSKTQVLAFCRPDESYHLKWTCCSATCDTHFSPPVTDVGQDISWCRIPGISECCCHQCSNPDFHQETEYNRIYIYIFCVCKHMYVSMSVYFIMMLQVRGRRIQTEPYRRKEEDQEFEALLYWTVRVHPKKTSV